MTINATQRYTEEPMRVYLSLIVLLFFSFTLFASNVDNSVVIAVADEPPSLDPTTNAAAAIDQILNQNVYEGLVRADRNGNIEPALAESFEVSSDGLTYTFHLRRGVLFHDGEPFTANDVLATFTRDMDKEYGHPHPEYYAHIEKIDTPDPYTVVFHLDQVNAAFISLLALGDSVILPAHLPPDIKNHPVGTGPFKFVEWKLGDHLTLVRFPGYYRKGIPKLEKVTFRFMPDQASAFAALLSGGVDIVARVPAEIALGAKDNPEIETIAGPQNLVQILAINNARAPFNDLRVRQAIAYALDRKKIIQGSMFGYGTPIGTHLTPANPYYVDLTGLYPHDPDKARALLAAAGYPDGFSTTLTLPQPYEIHVRTGEIIADQLSRVGIKAKIELVDWGQWLARVYHQADYDLTVIGHIGKLDPGLMLTGYGKDRPDYYFRRGYDNPELDALLDQGMITLDKTKRREIYAKAEEIIARDVVNYFIQDPDQIFLLKKGLSGFSLYPIYLINVTELFWSS